MYITTSLDSALHNLRDTKITRLVWADGIYINQDGIEERNQQVKQMGLVYQQADHTVIYLGEGTPETSLFLNTLLPKAPVDGNPPSLRSGSIEQVQGVLNPEVEVAAREWILARPWFKRVWILQELVLSQDPWVQCGTSVARWSSMDSHISEIAANRMLKPEEKLVQHMGNLHLQYRLDKRAKDLPSFAERLYDLLKSRKGFGVTDPRDMLFANLGLISHAIKDEDKLFNLIVVNYEKNETKVYSDLARYFLESLGDFRTFSLLDSNEKRNRSQAPSWAPDWISGPPSQFSRLSDELKYDRRHYNGNILLWASQFRVLVCGGVFLGVVRELGPIIEQSLCPQIARDFSELLHKKKGPLRELCLLIKSAFEKMYQSTRRGDTCSAH
jgi:hypothetical protein